MRRSLLRAVALCKLYGARSSIMQAIWGEEQPDSNSLKVHVHHLRKQLEATTHQVTLETIPSVGFAITANEGQPQ